MGLRPRTARARANKQRRCATCGCHVDKQRKRCKKCSHLLA